MPSDCLRIELGSMPEKEPYMEGKAIVGMDFPFRKTSALILNKMTKHLKGDLKSLEVKAKAIVKAIV